MSNPLATIYFDKVIVDRDDLGAILFRIDKEEIWIPRSLIEQLDEGNNEVEIPEWFAIKEELV
jgi:type II secretory pathway component GspD/PulD (secretin)